MIYILVILNTVFYFLYGLTINLIAALLGCLVIFLLCKLEGMEK